MMLDGYTHAPAWVKMWLFHVEVKTETQAFYTLYTLLVIFSFIIHALVSIGVFLV